MRHGAGQLTNATARGLVPSSNPAVTGYACALLTLSVALLVGSSIAGARWPMPASVLLLAVPLVWCMNRYVLFPNELGVTADAAVIAAAMLVYRGDAPWLGPLVIALLVGVFDVRHWEERSFVRMAYNSGSTALVAAAALGVFSVLVDRWGTSWTALLSASLVAAVPYVLLESCFGVVLVRLLGEHPGAAARQQLPLNAIAVPLAALGACAGLAGVELGWWATLVLLLPAPFVPELLLVTLPRHTTAAARWLAVAVVALGGSALVPAPGVRATAGLLALVALVLADRRPGSGRAGWVPLVVVATVPLAVFPLGLTTTTAIVSAAGAGVVVLALLGGDRARTVWVLPVVLLAAPTANLGARSGRAGAVVLVVVLVATMFSAVRFGLVPWPSRLLVRVRARPSQLVVSALGALAVALATVSAVTTGAAREHLAVLASVALEVLVVVAACAVDMWRFAPQRRVRDLVCVLGVGVTALVAVLPLIARGSVLAPGIVAVGSVIAWRCARVARDPTANTR